MVGSGSTLSTRLRGAARRAVSKRSGNKDIHEDTDGDQASPQLLFSDLEVDRLKIAFDMHSTSAARDSGGGLAAGPTAGGDENFVRIEDLKDLLRTLFIVPTSSELKSLTAAMDQERTGKICLGSFMNSIMAFMKPQYGRAMLDAAFDEISGGADEIDSTSLRRIMAHLGQSAIRFTDCEAMICEVDRQGRGRISRDDFRHLQTCTIDTI